jgi:hypothetical protein
MPPTQSQAGMMLHVSGNNEMVSAPSGNPVTFVGFCLISPLRARGGAGGYNPHKRNNRQRLPG